MCSICAKPCANERGLSIHITLVHNNDAQSSENLKIRKNTTKNSVKCQHCSLICKNQHGLRIHMGMKHKHLISDCAGSQPLQVVEVEEPLTMQSLMTDTAQHHLSDHKDDDFIHSKVVTNHNAFQNCKRKPTLKRPHPQNRKRWKKIEDAIMVNLGRSVPINFFKHGDIDEVVTSFENCIWDSISELEGTKERNTVKKKENQHRPGPRQLNRLRKQKNALRKEYRKQKQSGHEDVKNTCKLLRKALKAYSSLQKQAMSSKLLSDSIVQQSHFKKDPHKFSKYLLKPPVVGKPTFTKEVADDFFRKTYENVPMRERIYEPFPGLQRPTAPSVMFNTKVPSDQELSVTTRKKKNGSSPGFNGISYLVYKKCSHIRKKLLAIIQRVWKEKRIPLSWRIGRVTEIPKEEDTSHPSLMRPITVLNVEGRLFWSIFQTRLADFVIGNNYISNTIQKAFMEGVAGCIEHATIIAEMIKDAKQHQNALCLVWLDLANAYGSVNHMMIQFALKWYHIPREMIELIFNYYDQLFLQVHTEDWTSEWFQLAIGVAQGCTTSTMIFNIAFQLLLDIHSFLTKEANVGYTLHKSNVTVTRPTYADDVMLAQSFPKDGQISIDAFLDALEWSRNMKAKGKKWKCMALRRFNTGEKSTEFVPAQPLVYSSFDPKLHIKKRDNDGKITKEMITFIGDDKIPLFKYLGFKIQYDLKEDIIKDQIEKQLKHLLVLVDKTLLTGPMKAWITNHHICSKLAWFLLIYDFSKSQVADWHKLIHACYRKWFGLAKSAEPSILYRPNHHFGLNLKNLADLHKGLQVTKWHILKYSTDPQCRNLYSLMLNRDQKGHTGTGRTSTPRLTLERLERQTVLDKLAPTKVTAQGFRSSKVRDPTKKEKRTKLIDILKEEAENKRLLLLHDYEMQNGWMKLGTDLQDMRDKDLTWKNLISRYSEELTKFTLNATLQTLNTPDNLRRWNAATDLPCTLCGYKNVTLKHILAGCPWVFNVENKLPREDRYTWRHNCLLLRLARSIVDKLIEVNNKPEGKPQMLQHFVKAGTTPVKRRKTATLGILAQARDWRCNFDLPEFRQKTGGRLMFPQDIKVTNLRIDGYILSREHKVCILGPEMTAPMDDNVVKWHKKKSHKYRSSVADVKDWKFVDMAIEIGALGWIPPSVTRQLKSLGLTPKELNDLKQDLRHTARSCSYVIYVNRFNKDFHPWRIGDVRDPTDPSPVLDIFPNAQKVKSSKDAALDFLAKNISNQFDIEEELAIEESLLDYPH